MLVHLLVTFKVGDVDCFQPLNKLRIVHIIHAASIADDPINKVCVINVVNQGGGHQIVSVDSFFAANKLRLPISIK